MSPFAPSFYRMLILTTWKHWCLSSFNANHIALSSHSIMHSRLKWNETSDSGLSHILTGLFSEETMEVCAGHLMPRWILRIAAYHAWKIYELFIQITGKCIQQFWYCSEVSIPSNLNSSAMLCLYCFIVVLQTTHPVLYSFTVLSTDPWCGNYFQVDFSPSLIRNEMVIYIAS